MDQQTRELLSCALFNLDDRIVDKKAVINSMLIELSLFRLAGPSTKEEIIEEINKFIGNDKYFQLHDFESSIKDCEIRRTASFDESNSKYSLASTRQEEFDKSSCKVDDLRESISRNLMSYIELELVEPLKEKQSTTICSAFFEILTKEIYESSLLIVREKTTIEDVISNIDDSEPLKIIEGVLHDSGDYAIRLRNSKILFAIKKYMSDFPKELSEFLKLILINIFISQILNLDPSLVEMNIKWLKERQLYLDTNVLLSLFCKSHKMHGIVNEVIIACKQLGIELFISPITKDEILNQIKHSKRSYKNISSNSILQIAAKNGENAILADFYRKKFKEPALEWSAFIAAFENIDDLLLENNILVEDKCFKEAESAENYEEIRKIIHGEKPHWISENVLKHDVINCLIICCQKKDISSDERGQKVWLLTIDRSLKRSQKTLISSKKISNPYCLQISEWGEIVLPWINLIGLDYQNFLGYLAKAKFGIFPKGDFVQLNCFETIVNAKLNIDDLLELPPVHSKKAMIAIQEDNEIKKILEDVSKSDDQKKLEEIEEGFSSELKRIVSETDPKNDEIKSLEQKVELLTKKLDNASQQIEKFERNPIINLIRKIMRFFRINN